MRPVIFWDVHTQRDLLEPGGKLFIPGAEIEPRLARLTLLARERRIPLVASVLDHRLEDPEIALKNPDLRATFPPHCLRGTPGQEKVPATRPVNPLRLDSRPWPAAELEGKLAAHEGEILLLTHGFDVFENPNAERVLHWLGPRHVVVYGVAPDLARFPVDALRGKDVRVHVVRDAAVTMRPEEDARLLADWSSAGVGLPETGDLVSGGYLDRLA